MAWGWGVNASAPANELQVCTATTGCLAGKAGAAGGEMHFPAGIAVDNDPSSSSYGNVYVVDTLNHRVDKFTAAGAFLLAFGGKVNVVTGEDICEGAECKAGTIGTEPGQFTSLSTSSNLVSVPSAGPEAGIVYVGDTNRVQLFNAAGGHEGEIPLPAGTENTLYAIADDSGDVYVRPENLEGAGIREYDATGGELGTPRDESGEPYALALGPGEELFVDDDSAGQGQVLGYEPTGAQISSFEASPEGIEKGMAWSEAAKVIYAINQDATVAAVSSPPPGPVVDAKAVSVTAGLAGTATVSAKIDAESAETHYFVEYGLTDAYGEITAKQALGASFVNSAVTVKLEGLEPSTSYYYCVVAENANGVDRSTCEETPPRQFTSGPALEIEAEWSADVTSAGMVLYGNVDPEGTQTSCRFDYGAAAEYAASGVLAHNVPTSAIVVPGGNEVTVSASLESGIAPETTYAYRISCEKDGLTINGETLDVQTELATMSAGVLPDGRVREVVDDGDGAALTPPDLGLPIASADGQALVYLTSAPRSSAEQQSNRAPEPTVNLARHGANWSSKVLTTSYVEAAPLALTGPEYRLFAEDLTTAVMEPRELAPAPPPPTPLTRPATEWTPYLAEGLRQSGVFDPLVTADDVAPGVEFGIEDPLRYGLGGVEVQGGNADLSDVVLGSHEVPLLAGTVVNSLYLWRAGALSPVSTLPAGEGGESVSAALGSSGREEEDDTRGAISEDGRLVYWSAGNGLYVTDTSSGLSTRLDLPQGVAGSGPAEADFQMATPDGRHVFFTDTEALTPGATAEAGAADLYECTIMVSSQAPECELTDVTGREGVTPSEAAAVQGRVLGASSDGRRVFFVANGMLAAGAVSGAANLYMAVSEGGKWDIMLVAILSDEDINDWGHGNNELQTMSSRVTANGEYVAFMSDRDLTGYDTHDAASGAADEEAYLYHVKTGKLVCMTCAPTGERPHGVLDQGYTAVGGYGAPLDWQAVWTGRWIAGMLSSYHTGPGGKGHGLDDYQPRYLDDNGRMFFESATPLVREAPAPGTVGVYEYEPAGVGSCTTEDQQYESTLEGCVALLSPSDATGEATFMDASENGDDAFFMAAEKTSGAEGPAVYGVYDAHSCEAEADAACASAPAAEMSGCDTAASCKGEGAASVSASGETPASTTFEGTGNLMPSGAQVEGGGKSKSVSRAAKLEHALEMCARKKRAHKRHSCEARARKKYGNAARGSAVRKSKRSKR